MHAGSRYSARLSERLQHTWSRMLLWGSQLSPFFFFLPITSGCDKNQTSLVRGPALVVPPEMPDLGCSIERRKALTASITGMFMASGGRVGRVAPGDRELKHAVHPPMLLCGWGMLGSQTPYAMMLEIMTMTIVAVMALVVLVVAVANILYTRRSAGPNPGMEICRR